MNGKIPSKDTRDKRPNGTGASENRANTVHSANKRNENGGRTSVNTYNGAKRPSVHTASNGSRRQANGSDPRRRQESNSAKNNASSVKAPRPTIKKTAEVAKDVPKRDSLITKLKKSFIEPPKQGKSNKNDFIKPTDVVRIKSSYDPFFLILVIILTLFGLIMDFSASYAYAYNKFGDSFFFIKNQGFHAILGIIIMIVLMKIDYKFVRKMTVPMFLGSIALLVGVLLYGIAAGVAQRWISIGPISLQPSEVSKMTLVLMLALYVARNQDRITNYKNVFQSNAYGMIIPFIIVGTVCLLVALEKHFSGTIIIFAIGMVIIFAAGARLSWFIAAGIGAITVIGVAISTVPYAVERINMLRFPENYDPTGKIWQTLQGLYAVGSGGLFGVGLGNSKQKHLYVSQPQNDFVFSIIAEELGFAGAILVVVLFMLLIWRGFVIALKAPDTFSSLVVIGLISKVAIQAILNIAVVTNMIPNTGISLPFFSYGGTALIMQLAEMGVILSISRFSYQRKDTLN